MIKRTKYLNAIRPFYNSDLIKILIGIRRSGKSIILSQIKDEISEYTDNIVYIDFEHSMDFIIASWVDIYKYIISKKKEGWFYVFLDEVQEIDGWEILTKKLRDEKTSIFITGSNSKLLAREYLKELSGRCISFQIRPFVYKEILEYSKELNKEVSLMNYVIYGGFPKRFEFNDEKDSIVYLNDLFQTIVVNDLITRFKIKKIEEFKRFVIYVVQSNSRIFSADKIANYLCSNKINISSNTVLKWIEYLKTAFVIEPIERYSLKTKEALLKSKKLYLTDVSFNSIFKDKNKDVTHNLKNVVYNELLHMGYKLKTYENDKHEIDFYAEKDGLNYFIQVSYSVAEQDTYEREFNAFNMVNQSDKKIIITNDDIDYSTSNVKHVKFKDFLLLDDLKQID